MVKLKFLSVATASLWLASGAAFAAKLDPSNWVTRQINSVLPPPSNLRIGQPDPTATNVSSASVTLTDLTDGNPATLITLSNRAVLSLDLGQSSLVHRVFLAGGNRKLAWWPDHYANRSNPPLGLIVVSVGDTPQTIQPVAEFTVPYDAGNPVNTEADLRFRPTSGRYIKIELQTQVTWGKARWPGYALSSQPSATNVAWNVAELEVYGFAGINAPENAVVLPNGAADPLVLAANELSYYLGELTGKPHPIITPGDTNQYSGTIYRIIDLKPLAPDYTTMTNNMASGLLPDGVNVEIHGREVVFKAWPYRCVLWSVWEFLERQGVRWLYPDSHGDFVPIGQGVRLDLLPLRFTPSARSIYANWDASSLQPWPVWMKQSLLQSYLYPWRNRWTSSWDGSGLLGGNEIPAKPSTGIALHSDYSEQFSGYPHNFNSVVPNRILQQHTNWWGFNPKLGMRVNPTNAGATAFCMNHPELIEWVANKLVAVAASYPKDKTAPSSLRHFNRAFNLLPLDATAYCQCPEWCSPANANSKYSGVAWVRLYNSSFSGMYYNFVNQVAKAVKSKGSDAIVGALAYADVYDPPVAITNFESNVQVEVCLYGSPNLPMSSPRNAAQKQVFDQWASKGVRLANYDYLLLHTDYWQPNASLPVPLVAATVDSARYLARTGALEGGSQATLESLPYNPWNFYAYPRIRWNTNQTGAQLVQEFFSGYFREVAAPMQAYYRVLEDHLITNNVNMHYQGYCYAVTPNAFPRHVLAAMKTHLETAEGNATNWFVIDRVAKLREGFDWVISSSKLTGVNLTNVSIYPAIIGATTIDLSSMRAPAIFPRGNFAYPIGGEWHFLAQGKIETPLRLVQGGDYQLTILARAVPADNVWPVMNVFLGSSAVSTTVSSTDYVEYTFTVSAPSAVWDLVITYDNAASGGRRNLIIKQIRIASQ